MYAIDLAVLGAYVAWSAGSGLASAKKASESLEEYFLAGRTLSGWSAGISMAATQFAADTPLVVTGLVARRMWIYAVAFLLLAFVLGASWRRAGVLTDAELSELRYGGRFAALLRGIKAIHFGLVFNCTVLAMVLLATTRIVAPFGRWDQWLPEGVFAVVRGAVEGLGLSLAAGSGECGASCAADCIRGGCFDDAAWNEASANAISLAIVLGVTALYSTTGGLRAVVRTDLVQFSIAMISTLAYAWIVVERAGGLSVMQERLRGIAPEDTTAITPFEVDDLSYAWVAVVAVQWLAQINADGSGYLAQRTMACRSDRDARLAGVVFTVAQVLVRSLVWLPIALGLLVIFRADGPLDAAEREATFVQGITMLPPGLLGLMLAGMLGALASTLDTHLNWGSSYVTNDLFARFIAPRMLGRSARPRELVMVARVSNLAILVGALAIVPHLESIQEAWHASLLLGAGLGTVLVLRWIWWRTTALSEIAAIAVSLVSAPLAMTLIESEPVRLLIVASGATAAAVLAALLGPAEDRGRLERFVERARPLGSGGRSRCVRARERDWAGASSRR